MDLFKSRGAIVPDKTNLELIDHVAMANGPPTTTESPMSFNESTSVDPSSSESSKKDSDMKSSERPSSSMEESSAEADHVQSDHHESSDATTVLPTTTVLSTTNQELKDSPASSKEEPLTTLPSFGTGSSSESAQSSSEASLPWDVSSESPAWNEVDGDLDKKGADQTGSEWGGFFGTGHQQEDFNNQLSQIDPTEASSSTSSTTGESVNEKVKDELPLNDEKPKEEPPRINVAGHGSSSASVSKGFNLIAVVASVLFLFTVSH